MDSGLDLIGFCAEVHENKSFITDVRESESAVKLRPSRCFPHIFSAPLPFCFGTLIFVRRSGYYGGLNR
jgi:hypothetical protein